MAIFNFYGVTMITVAKNLPQESLPLEQRSVMQLKMYKGSGCLARSNETYMMSYFYVEWHAVFHTALKYCVYPNATYYYIQNLKLCDTLRLRLHKGLYATVSTSVMTFMKMRDTTFLVSGNQK